MRSLIPTWSENHVRQLFRRDVVPSWLNASWFRKHGVGWNTPNQADGKEGLKHSLYRTLTETSLPQLLRSEDHNSMAFSIESRVPFLTPGLAKFLFTLPEHYIITSHGTSKAIFRQAMRGIVPDVILDRTDKLGFSMPEKNWLLSIRPYVECVLNSQTATQIHAINTKEIQGQWQQMVNGSRQLDSRVWRWMNLILWAEKFSVTGA
jgi:asparagine synthase (glutamine-hydrolysing)